jgi:hypothetical protein
MKTAMNRRKKRLNKKDVIDLNRKSIFQDITDVIGTPNLSSDKKQNRILNSDWITIPVTLEEFCRDMVGEELFPEQLEYGNAVMGVVTTEFPVLIVEHLAYWGKGSGKDRTVAKMQAYLIYKLMCLRNPQGFLRRIYNCSIADGDAIDIVNVSINARQAENVYFRKFKSIIKMVKDADGLNWFEKRGVVLEEGVHLQTTEAFFPNDIFVHSLNSETNTGEGLNILFAAIDEFGGWKGIENANNLLDNIISSAKSRFKTLAKVCILSYNYYPNDPMDMLYKTNTKDDDVEIYKSKKKSWEVNPFLSKSDFKREYSRNPEKAKMQYECESDQKQGGYISKKYMIEKMYESGLENPFLDDITSCSDLDLLSIKFKKSFIPSDGYYIMHIDLATGKKRVRGIDCAGVTLSHMEAMSPKLDNTLKKDLMKNGVVFDTFESEYTSMRKGVVIDMHLQVYSDGHEIEFNNFRMFIMRLRELGFNIYMVTYDGWESRDSIQILNREGIESMKHSVDTSNESYDLMKSLIYQQLIKTYYSPIIDRELKELIINDKGKVDHPERSYLRLETESNDKGSKDVSDCFAANCSKIYSEFEIESGISFA